MLPTFHKGKVLFSSKLVAQETGKRHDHVIRDIRAVLDAAKDAPDLGHVEKKDARGYTSEFLLDEILLMTLLTGYSVELRLRVVRRLDELERHIKERNAARLESPAMTAALQDARHDAGKETASHHYSNEYNMLNRIVLGETAKKYRATHGFDPATPIRDCMTPCEVAAIADLQRVNTSLIEAGIDYDERKTRLAALYRRKHQPAITAELLRLES